MISGPNLYVLTLTLTSAANVVSGSGTIAAPYTGSVAVAVAGTLTDAGTFSLSMTAGGAQPIVYVGTVTGSFMRGKASGGGYRDDDLVLTSHHE